MAAITATAITAAVGLTTSAIAAGQANKQRKTEERKGKRLQQQLDDMEAARPVFKNPYENVTNQFANLNNPYANLTVSTEAAKMQAEEADIALANTLDMMKESGAGAGGATALAQAALQSKRGIAASIESQEAQNKKLAADGKANIDRLKAEGAQNVMNLKAEGDAMEQRDAQAWHDRKMDRVSTLLDNSLQNERDAAAARNAAIVGVGSALSDAAGIGVETGAFKKG